MAVPDSENFTMWDVTTEIYGDNNAGRNLQDCFSDATLSYFNSAYKSQYYSDYGNQDNLLMFRKYGEVLSGVQYISKGTISEKDSSGTTLVVNTPSNTEAGDLLIMSIMFQTSSGYSFNLDGWNLINISSVTDIDPKFYARVYWKSADANESDVSLTLSEEGSAIIYQFRNSPVFNPYFNDSSNISQYINYSDDITGATEAGELGVVIQQSNLNLTGNYTGTDWNRENDVSSTYTFSHKMFYYPFSSAGDTSLLQSPGFNAYHNRVQLIIKNI